MGVSSRRPFGRPFGYHLHARHMLAERVCCSQQPSVRQKAQYEGQSKSQFFKNIITHHGIAVQNRVHPVTYEAHDAQHLCP